MGGGWKGMGRVYKGIRGWGRPVRGCPRVSEGNCAYRLGVKTPASLPASLPPSLPPSPSRISAIKSTGDPTTPSTPTTPTMIVSRFVGEGGDGGCS